MVLKGIDDGLFEEIVEPVSQEKVLSTSMKQLKEGPWPKGATYLGDLFGWILIGEVQYG